MLAQLSDPKPNEPLELNTALSTKTARKRFSTCVLAIPPFSHDLTGPRVSPYQLVHFVNLKLSSLFVTESALIFIFLQENLFIIFG